VFVEGAAERSSIDYTSQAARYRNPFILQPGGGEIGFRVPGTIGNAAPAEEVRMGAGSLAGKSPHIIHHSPPAVGSTVN